jgi:hypothetical protein
MHLRHSSNRLINANRVDQMRSLPHSVTIAWNWASEFEQLRLSHKSWSQRIAKNILTVNVFILLAPPVRPAKLAGLAHVRIYGMKFMAKVRLESSQTS